MLIRRDNVAPMDLKEYKKRLTRIWFLGFFGLLCLLGTVKWKAYTEGLPASHSVIGDIVWTVALSLFLPTIVVARGYYRFKSWLPKGGPHLLVIATLLTTSGFSADALPPAASLNCFVGLLQTLTGNPIVIEDKILKQFDPNTVNIHDIKKLSFYAFFMKDASGYEFIVRIPEPYSDLKHEQFATRLLNSFAMLEASVVRLLDIKTSQLALEKIKITDPNEYNFFKRNLESRTGSPKASTARVSISIYYPIPNGTETLELLNVDDRLRHLLNYYSRPGYTIAGNNLTLNGGIISSTDDNAGEALYQEKITIQLTGNLNLINGGTIFTNLSSLTAVNFTISRGNIYGNVGSPNIGADPGINVTNLTIAAGSSIKATARGYTGGIYDGNSTYNGVGTGGGTGGDLLGGAGGGAHGGNGNILAGGTAYDSVTNPIEYGSGGGASPGCNGQGGRGGEIFRVVVSGTLNVSAGGNNQS